MIIVSVKIQSVPGRGVGCKTGVSGTPANDQEKLLLHCIRDGIRGGMELMDSYMRLAGAPEGQSFDGPAADVAEQAVQQGRKPEGN
jgi:hypothetical protein